MLRGLHVDRRAQGLFRDADMAAYTCMLYKVYIFVFSPLFSNLLEGA